jgi:hypothetical protein
LGSSGPSSVPSGVASHGWRSVSSRFIIGLFVHGGRLVVLCCRIGCGYCLVWFCLKIGLVLRIGPFCRRLISRLVLLDGLLGFAR